MWSGRKSLTSRRVWSGAAERRRPVRSSRMWWSWWSSLHGSFSWPRGTRPAETGWHWVSLRELGLEWGWAVSREDKNSEFIFKKKLDLYAHCYRPLTSTSELSMNIYFLNKMLSWATVTLISLIYRRERNLYICTHTCRHTVMKGHAQSSVWPWKM